MRWVDEKKDIKGKAQLGINFEKIVANKLEERARETCVAVSKLCNDIVKEKVMNEQYRDMIRTYFRRIAESTRSDNE